MEKTLQRRPMTPAEIKAIKSGPHHVVLLANTAACLALAVYEQTGAPRGPEETREG